MRISIAVGLVLAFGSYGRGATWHVNVATCPGIGTGSVSEPFCEIQSGIDAASDGDTVIVAPGRYFENIHLLGKNITLRSTDPANPAVVAATIIDGSQPADLDAASTVSFDGTEGPTCVLDGLTITGGGGTLIMDKRVGAGINGNGALASLTRSRVVANVFVGDFGAGIYDLDGAISFSSVLNNIIYSGGNTAYAGGLAFCDGPISDSIIDSNRADPPSCCQGQAGGLYQCSGPITRCTITNNVARERAGALKECHGPIIDCFFAFNDSEDGAALEDCDGPVTNCTFLENFSNDSGGIILNSDGAKMLCTFTQNTGAIIVGSSGDLNNCSFVGNVPWGGSQAMINTSAVSGIRVMNCLFENNTGMLMQGNFEEIVDCTFIGNDSGDPLIRLPGSDCTILRTQFVNNQSVIGRYDGMLSIYDSTFIGNSEFSLDVFNGHLEIMNSKFIENDSEAALIFGENSSTFSFGNCIFGGNHSAGAGGTLYAGSGCSFDIVNSVFVGNESEDVGGAIFMADGTSSVTNCIFRDNVDVNSGGAGSNIHVASGVVTVTQSNLQGGWNGPGLGNIDADPLFVDADGTDDIIGTKDDDLRLSAGSPCIDAGDNNAAIAAGLTTDLHGLLRFIDEPSVPNTGVGVAPIVDMGAYEYAASLLVPPGVPSAPYDRRKNRYVSFVPQSDSILAAHRLSKVTAPTGECWVDAPDLSGNAHCATDPVYRLWSEPIVHVGDCEVVPVAEYEIAATVDAAAFTPSLPVSTIALPTLNGKFWGDVSGMNNGMEWTPPNQFTNVQDIIAVLAYITNASIKPTFQEANLQSISSVDPCLNAFVNTADVLIIVKAVAGDAYPFTTNPANCPVCP